MDFTPSFTYKIKFANLSDPNFYANYSYLDYSILGHIHGVLWTYLEKLEELIYDEEENLRIATKDELHDEKIIQPLKGLKEVFQKLRNDDNLNADDLACLEKFIDGFTTVSLNPNVVGEDVVEIVEAVNVHHHSKTCRKYDSSCRFNYPKFPTPKTIVAKPLKKEERQNIMTKYNEILQKVSCILDDKEFIDKIMLDYSKKTESKTEYPKLIEERVKKIHHFDTFFLEGVGVGGLGRDSR